ncbi:MAG: hypothetical protein K0R92_2523 [Lachnospiraceae bacterium]|jgi:hypothetical protein|nr:hypothetical protein [Lachnospiraceae bacterium]
MKKLLILLCAFIIIILFVVFQYQENETPTLELSRISTSDINNNVVLSIKENSITSETQELTLVYENKSKEEYIYGGVDFLEIEADDKWYSLTPKENVQWNMLAYTLPPEDITESIFFIKAHFGDLTKGKYRIIKELSQLDKNNKETYVIAEFTIK